MNAIDDIRKHCIERSTTVNERLLAGAETMAQHETRITTTEEHYKITCKKIDRLSDKIDVINSRIPALLGGIVVACILLAINVVIGAF